MLQPCVGCMRHVDTRDARCIFCGAEIVAHEPRPTPGMRLSRAALFAGITLAGCAPSPYETVHPHANTGVVRGVLRDQHHRPVAGAKVSTYGVSGASDHQHDMTTDNMGRYALELPPGEHSIHFEVNDVHGHRVTYGGTQFSVTLKAGEVKELHPQMSISEGDMGARPYGAPPARRRIV